MTFNIGDRVRINRNCVISEWWGEEGTVVLIDRYVVAKMDNANINSDDVMRLNPNRWDLIEPAFEEVVEEDWS